jgi:replicative DNA helicase
VPNIPPHNIDAETAILGSVLNDNNAIAKVTLDPSEFYVPANQKIFRAMVQLSATSQPIDFLTLSDVLGDQLTAVGGVPKT